eukprot:1061680-Pyramimonas_sp.AAC.1
MEARMDALQDVEKLRRAFKRPPSWRAAPAWSVAGDLPRVLATPNWYYKRHRRRGLRGPNAQEAPEQNGPAEDVQAPVFRRGHSLQEGPEEPLSTAGPHA